MSDSETDPTFAVLPARLRRRIDRAFDTVAKQANGARDGAGPSRKKRKLDSQTPAAGADFGPGGFIVEDAPAPGGFIVDDPLAGGFIPDDSMGGGFVPSSTASTADEDEVMAHSSEADHIPFGLIPSALQLLDLQPDDEDVLSVFRNAATGWENRHAARAEPQDDSHLLVSRKDWRAVCAALLDAGDGGDGEDVDEEGDEENVEGYRSEEASGEEYVESGDEFEFGEGDEDSEDEYQEGGFERSKAAGPSRRNVRATKKSVKTKKRRSLSDSSLSSLESDDDSTLQKGPRRITARQKAEARRAFAMFFPDVPDESLDKQKIMIKDITRVATLLKEKLTAEEVRFVSSWRDNAC